jgi:hypothetical protein
MPAADVTAIFDDKLAYLREYQADWKPWLDELKAGWPAATTDLLTTLKTWWEPLLRMAPTLCDAVGASCLLRTRDLEILIDFPNATGTTLSVTVDALGTQEPGTVQSAGQRYSQPRLQRPQTTALHQPAVLNATRLDPPSPAPGNYQPTVMASSRLI